MSTGPDADRCKHRATLCWCECLVPPIGGANAGKVRLMDKDELPAWALKNGWQIMAGAPSLAKPSAPKEAIVRLVFKATVVNLEIKKPAGKWERISGESY